MQAVAFSGLLLVDTTVLVLTVNRSIQLWTRKEPFLHRLLIDGMSMTHALLLSELTLRYHQVFCIMGMRRPFLGDT